MTPYREKWVSDCGTVTLYLGDCLEILPTLEPGSDVAIVTDPPYGLADKWQGGTWGAASMYEDARKWDVALSQEQFEKSCLAASQCVVWGANYYSVPPSRCWLSWLKSSTMHTMADFELAWTSFDKPSKCFREDRNPDGKRQHPTQKPISVMKWSIGFVSCDVVLDPYTGSGTTGVACVRLGRRFIGIELEPKYFAIAKRRITDELRRVKFLEPTPKQTQRSLIKDGDE